MQLPSSYEIVMVAGTPPIRAKKARYYEDGRLNERILPPPDPGKRGRSVRADNWSALSPQEPSPTLLAETEKAGRDAANSGLRREPELPDHVAIARATSEPKRPEEFAIKEEDETADGGRQNSHPRQQMRKKGKGNDGNYTQ